jgi:hypothetical protein
LGGSASLVEPFPERALSFKSMGLGAPDEAPSVWTAACAVTRIATQHVTAGNAMSGDREAQSFRIETLDATFEAYGAVLDLLSRHAPFSEFRLNQIGTTIRAQLKQKLHVAALSPKNELVAYAGWVHTLQASAGLWVAGSGPLQVVEKNHDALAMTVVVSEVPAAVTAMMRRCRELNPGLRGYFKRSYDGQLRSPRKQSVRITDAAAPSRAE